jgi:hypothetical protein
MTLKVFAAASDKASAKVCAVISVVTASMVYLDISFAPDGDAR